METKASTRNIIIAPQIYVSLEPKEAQDDQETKLKRTEIPMVWIQDGDSFRLDIDLPESSALDVTFCTPLASLHINGETIWANQTPHAVRITGTHIEMTPAGLRLTCTFRGAIHILALGVSENEREKS
jgi:hypothetical protein